MMKKTLNQIFLSLVIILSSATMPAITFADNNLTSSQLKELLIGNFLKVVYLYENEGVNMWEFYHKDGTVAGSTDKWGDYKATYEITDEDQICLTYSSQAYNGCYSYQHISGNDYKLVGLTWPENSTATVTIVKGHYKNIDNN